MLKTLFLLALCLSIAQTRMLQDSQILNAIESIFQSATKLITLTKEVDYSFDYDVPKTKTVGLDYAPFLFGTHEGRSSEGTPVKLHVDTSLKGIALASGALAGSNDNQWGIDCSGATQTNCTYVTNQTTPQTDFTNGNCPAELTGYELTSAKAMTTQIPFWNPTGVKCRDGVTFMRWANSSLPDNTHGGDLAQNLPVTLFETEPSIGVSAGYLGLSPVGQFFNYVIEKTDWDNKDYVLFGLSLTPNSGASKLVDDTKKDLWKQNQLVIHGKRNGGSAEFYSPLIPQATSWTIENANFTLHQDAAYPAWVPAENQKVCLSSKYPHMLGFKDATQSATLMTYFNKVCGETPDPNNCKESDAKKDNVKKVQLGFSNTTVASADLKSYNVTLDPSDFLWFHDEKIFTSLVGNVVKPEDWGCDTSADMVVGRAFLSRNEAVMNITKNGKSLAFIANEGTSSIFLIILIILGCIILAICIAIILLKVCKRKSDTEGDYQRTSD